MPTKKTGSRSAQSKLNLYWLVFNVALETDIKELLSKLQVRAFSRWDEVKGSGNSGPHLNDEVWPVVNGLYLFAAPAALESEVAQAVTALRKLFPGEGVKLIVQPCSAVY